MEEDSRPGVIGRPVANVSLFVVDKYLHLLPKGCIGELVISGNGVGRGYLNDNELTASCFPSIVVNGRKIRVYRTGDLARWNAAGQLEFIGRTDSQVKLRGFRIELQEIESQA